MEEVLTETDKIKKLILDESQRIMDTEDYDKAVKMLEFIDRAPIDQFADSDIQFKVTLLKSIVETEKQRRADIELQGEEYEKYNARLTAYEQLNQSLSSILSNVERYKDTPAMVAYYNKVSEIFGTNVTSLQEVNELVNSEITQYNQIVTKINQLNGVFDKEAAKKDLERAKEIAAKKQLRDDKNKQRKELRDKLKTMVSSDEYDKFTGKGGVTQIKNAIKALEAIKKPSPDQKKLLETLKSLKDVTPIKCGPVVNKKKGIDENKELKQILQTYEVKDVAQLEDKITKLSAKTLTDPEKNRIKFVDNIIEDNTYFEDTKPKQWESIDIPKSIGSSIDDAVKYAQKQGFVSVAGKNTFTYLRPQYDGDGNIRSMTLMKESIDNLSKEGLTTTSQKALLNSYKQALKDFQKRYEKANPDLSKKQIEDMCNKMRNYTKSFYTTSNAGFLTNMWAKLKGENVKREQPGDYDELLKRTIALKTAVSNVDMRLVASSQENEYVGVSAYPGNESFYRVPHRETDPKDNNKLIVHKDTPSLVAKVTQIKQKFVYTKGDVNKPRPVQERLLKKRKLNKDLDKDER